MLENEIKFSFKNLFYLNMHENHLMVNANNYTI